MPDQRLTIMFCAFDGSPLILRLYGQGQSMMRGTPEYGAMLRHFEKLLVPDRSPRRRPRADVVRYGGSTVRLRGNVRVRALRAPSAKWVQRCPCTRQPMRSVHRRAVASAISS